MARTVKWTEAATSDLEEVAKFIERDSQFYVAAIVREARATARSLRTFAGGDLGSSVGLTLI